MEKKYPKVVVVRSGIIIVVGIVAFAIVVVILSNIYRVTRHKPVEKTATHIEQTKSPGWYRDDERCLPGRS